MQEYKDGTFGEIRERIDLIHKLLDDEGEIEKTKSIHFGTTDELEKKKVGGGFKKSVEKRLAALERQQNGNEIKMNKILIHLGLCQDEILV